MTVTASSHNIMVFKSITITAVAVAIGLALWSSTIHIADAASTGQGCKTDHQCPDEMFCNLGGGNGRCSQCHDCEKKERRLPPPLGQPCAREQADCGKCLPGYEEHSRKGLEIAEAPCRPINGERESNPSSFVRAFEVQAKPEEDSYLTDVLAIAAGAFLITFLLLMVGSYKLKGILEVRKARLGNHEGLEGQAEGGFSCGSSTTEHPSAPLLYREQFHPPPPPYNDLNFERGSSPEANPVRIATTHLQRASPFHAGNGAGAWANGDNNGAEENHDEHDAADGQVGEDIPVAEEEAVADAVNLNELGDLGEESAQDVEMVEISGENAVARMEVSGLEGASGPSDSVPSPPIQSPNPTQGNNIYFGFRFGFEFGLIPTANRSRSASAHESRGVVDIDMDESAFDLSNYISGLSTPSGLSASSSQASVARSFLTDSGTGTSNEDDEAMRPRNASEVPNSDIAVLHVVPDPDVNENSMYDDEIGLDVDEEE